jgi:hypothetical protein
MAAPKNNLYALGHHYGRPKKFSTAKELDEECYNFFQWCVDNKEVITVSGLLLYLNISHTTKNRWLNGEIDTDTEVFSSILDRAIGVIENAYEKKLDTFAFGGAVFALKNIRRKEWSDVTHQEINQKITDVRANFNNSVHTTQETSGDTPTD